MTALAAVQVSARQATRHLFGNFVGAAVVRLVGALLLEQNDAWAIQRRSMTLETLAPISNDPAVRLPAVAA